MRRRAALSDEELELWAHVAASVKPLPGRRMPKIENAKPPAPPVRPAGLFASLAEAPPAAPKLKPLVPLERRMRQRVSRGRAPIDGIIDLHGMRQDEAHRALLNFIHRKHHDGASVVIVVTGKGGTDPARERGVLRRMVPHWLADPGMRSYVLGYEEAAQHHGGGGALYVRIRRSREGR
ncbi:MAG: Smr/MutS family protein [Beijerinckiaceae bacterium]